MHVQKIKKKKKKKKEKNCSKNVNEHNLKNLLLGTQLIRSDPIEVSKGNRGLPIRIFSISEVRTQDL